MKKLLTVTLLSSVIIAGCQPANITAVKWDTGEKGANVQTRCERVDMRDRSEMQSSFARYDGWKLIYISEYTTGNKSGTDAAICFERLK
ncbi:MAG TPA: hypothetical protein DCZ75_03085 [Geobacter sp.]|nr:hypothetical protein [Geobacter sp.]